MMTVRNSTDAKENQRFDARPIDLLGSTRASRVIGELDEDGVERLYKHVDGEGGGDGGKAKRQAGQGVPPDSKVGNARERDQDQIARIRRNARQDADEGQDIGEGPSAARR